jgi:hypothetical protein
VFLFQVTAPSGKVKRYTIAGNKGALLEAMAAAHAPVSVMEWVYHNGTHRNLKWVYGPRGAQTTVRVTRKES